MTKTEEMRSRIGRQCMELALRFRRPSDGQEAIERLYRRFFDPIWDDYELQEALRAIDGSAVPQKGLDVIQGLPQGL